MSKVNINGVEHDLTVSDDTVLLWAIRDDAGLPGTKFGCGAGLCGACTVHVDGVAVRSCQLTLSDVANKTVTTIEGLSNDGSHPLQQAWKDNNVPQCGFCQAGQIMQAASLLSENPKATGADIREGMAGNICRCGTYERIISAVHQAALET